MARTHVFEGLSKLDLKPINQNSALRFRLTFGSSSQTETVQFEVSSGHAMAILHGIQTIQRKHGWRMPYGPPRGKPILKIVSSYDD